MSNLNALERRIIDISKKYDLSHISSSLTAVNIIDKIYQEKKENDIFILSSGHAFVALAVVLEKFYAFDAEKLILKHGTHPHRDLEDKIYFSTGSLGCGVSAAVGFALSDRQRNVYCLCSDGECGEPNVFSALSFAHQRKLNNFKVYFNINGCSAYDSVDVVYLAQRLTTTWDEVNLVFTNLGHIPTLNGLQGHYKVLSDKEYEEIVK